MLKRASPGTVRWMLEAWMRELRGRERWMMQLRVEHPEGRKLPTPLLFGVLRKWVKWKRTQEAAKTLSC